MSKINLHRIIEDTIKEHGNETMGVDEIRIARQSMKKAIQKILEKVCEKVDLKIDGYSYYDVAVDKESIMKVWEEVE